jgi:hypothetical protein
VKNIFLVYIPPSNAEAMVHYEETIRKKVLPERVYRYVDDSLLTSDQNIQYKTYYRLGFAG